MAENISSSGRLRLKNGLWILGAFILLTLIVLGLAGPVLNFPKADEANYLLQARNIAQGQMPYRDFYEFITPGGQLFGAFFAWLNGFSVVGLRIWVVFGWLLELLLIYEMAKDRLSKQALFLLLAFIWLSDACYPVFQHHFFSGLTALLAVYFVWRYLQTLYAGKVKPVHLAMAGAFTALTYWVTQSLGVLMVLAIGTFSLLHCLLHEREEKGLGYRQVGRMAVLRRWVNLWGRWWALPMLGVHALCIGVIVCLGLWTDFLRDTVLWVLGGHYQKTTVIGYFATFHREFVEILRPLLDGVPPPFGWIFLFRVPSVVHLFLIGVLPVIGLLGIGYVLPGRFMYRLLRLEDEALLLWWITAVALIFSTFSYGTSMHMVSNAALAFMLGGLALSLWFSKRGKRAGWLHAGVWALFGLVLAQQVIGSLMILLLGAWLPRLPGLREPLLYTEAHTKPAQFAKLVGILQKAADAKRTVFVFCQTPSIYLAGTYRNATRFTLVIPQYTTQRQMAEVMRDLERNKPLYIVDDQSLRTLSQDMRFSAFSPEQLRLPGLEQYLKVHYVPQETLGRFTLYRRRTGYFE